MKSVADKRLNAFLIWDILLFSLQPLFWINLSRSTVNSLNKTFNWNNSFLYLSLWNYINFKMNKVLMKECIWNCKWNSLDEIHFYFTAVFYDVLVFLRFTINIVLSLPSIFIRFFFIAKWLFCIWILPYCISKLVNFKSKLDGEGRSCLICFCPFNLVKNWKRNCIFEIHLVSIHSNWSLLGELVEFVLLPSGCFNLLTKLYEQVWSDDNF